MTLEYVVELSSSAVHVPKHVQIADAIARDIARGRLAPGDRLPGSRTLASMLGVNRNTVNAALAELTAQGWVEATPARGVFVRASERDPEPRPFARNVLPRASVPERAGFALGHAPRARVGEQLSKHALVLTGGVPDPRLFPRELLARAYRRALRARGAELLDYGDAFGEPRLRRALSGMLSTTRGVAASEHDVLVTRGSQQALWLAAHALLTPGARIAVESFGYQPAWDAFRSTGAKLVPIELDAEGLRVDALERVLRAGPIAALYLTPHHQYPTMVALSAPRRLALLELAKKHRFAILEDDYSHEFHYEGRPRLPLASADRHGVVVYVGSLSKILAPGLRIGYAVAPRPVLERMAAMRTFVDRQGDAIAEAAVAELFEDGEVLRHARRMRTAYRARRDAFAEALVRELGERVSFDVPSGGMALWVRVNDDIDPGVWVERARERNVLFRTGRELHIDKKPVPFVRMGFTRLSERELERAARELARAWP